MSRLSSPWLTECVSMWPGSVGAGLSGESLVV